jgi:peptidoglycan-associated lipoprotein
VKQETFDSELSKIREEMKAEMQGVDQRVDSLEQRTMTLERELAQFREEFGARVEQAEAAITFNLPVHFEFDESTLRPEDQPVLDKFAQVVGRHYSQALITVEGFADPAGDRQYNMWLGEQRAQAVREYLGQRGLEGNRIKVVSYGEAADRQVVPGAQGPGQEGMENRRVALVIDYGGDSSEPVAGRTEP